MADDYQAQLLAVEAKLAKDPDNEELLTLKADLLEIIELSGSLEEDEEQERQLTKQSQQKQQHQTATSRQDQQHTTTTKTSHKPSSGSGSWKTRTNEGDDDDEGEETSSKRATNSLPANLVSSGDGATERSDTGQRRPLTEAELLAKRKEKNRKKKAKLREKFKEQQDTAESVKQSWQSFANQRGLKGLSKRSIFASPSSVTGKVGVGTNGIADVAPTKGARFPPAAGATGSSSSASLASSAPISKRRY